MGALKILILLLAGYDCALPGLAILHSMETTTQLTKVNVGVRCLR